MIPTAIALFFLSSPVTAGMNKYYWDEPQNQYKNIDCHIYGTEQGTPVSCTQKTQLELKIGCPAIEPVNQNNKTPTFTLYDDRGMGTESPYYPCHNFWTEGWCESVRNDEHSINAPIKTNSLKVADGWRCRFYTHDHCWSGDPNRSKRRPETLDVGSGESVWDVGNDFRHKIRSVKCVEVAEDDGTGLDGYFPLGHPWHKKQIAEPDYRGYWQVGQYWYARYRPKIGPWVDTKERENFESALDKYYYMDKDGEYYPAEHDTKDDSWTGERLGRKCGLDQCEITQSSL